MLTGRYSPLSLTAGQQVSLGLFVGLFVWRGSHIDHVQLSLNSSGASRLSLIPSATEGFSLYGLLTCPSLDFGRAFSSAGSVVTVGRFEEKGMRKGGMVGDYADYRSAM